jgi:hypothetical protein
VCCWLLIAFGAGLGCAQTANQEPLKLAVLTAGSETYSNVAITSVTATDIYFTHSRGIGNVKLKRLDPELQSKFHFDPVKGAEKEQEQSRANASFLTEVAKQPLRQPIKQDDQTPTVLVDVLDPTMEYKYYNLSQPKPPEIAEGMLGCTMRTFRCSVDLTLHPIPGTNAGQFVFGLEMVRISLELPITTTLPNGASQHLKEHEEGHRTINEHYYSFSRNSAERAGKQAVRTRFVSFAPDIDSAEASARSMAENAIQTEYWKYTSIPSLAANRYYDELTDHGRNSTNSIVAVEEAIARFDVRIPPVFAAPSAQSTQEGR